MNEKNFGYLGSSFQQSLLKAIIEDKKFAVTIIDVIESKYFDGPYFKYVMENVKELYKSFGVVPNYETLTQKILAENTNVSSKIHIDTLNAIKEKALEDDGGYVKKTALNFCRQQVLKASLKEAEEIMTNGDFENYDKIENKIRNALQVGTIVDDIEDISENILNSLEDDSRVPFSTGIQGIDNILKGGIARGELAIFLAPTGIGKTTWLTKMANSAYGCGANVLQIFFEDNMVDVRRKHYTIWTGIPSHEQPARKHEVKEIVEKATSNHPNFLKLVKYPSGKITINDIRNKIRKLESEGFKLDLLVLDYIDCVAGEGTATGDEWKSEGATMRSLESMTDEFNIAIWTATQGNRYSIGSDVVTTDQMGGSIKKAQIGHVVISAAKTLEQKEHNLANVTLLKSRIGKDGIVFQNCTFDNEHLIFDTDSQNTLLGHQEDRAKANSLRASTVYKKGKEEKEESNSEVIKPQDGGRSRIEAAISNSPVVAENLLNELQNLDDITVGDVKFTPNEENIEDITFSSTTSGDTMVETVVTPTRTVLTQEELNRKLKSLRKGK